MHMFYIINNITPSLMDWLNSWATGAANTTTPSLKNHAGIWSNPVAVGRILSSKWKTSVAA